jgi:hypothetical protein
MLLLSSALENHSLGGIFMQPITVCISKSFTFSCLSQDFAWKICRNHWSYELVWEWFTKSWIFLPKVRQKYANWWNSQPDFSLIQRDSRLWFLFGHVVIMFSWAERDVLSSATEGYACSKFVQLTNTRRPSVRLTQDSLQNGNSTFSFRRICFSYNARVLHLLRIPVTRSGRNFLNNYEMGPDGRVARGPTSVI